MSADGRVDRAGQSRASPSRRPVFAFGARSAKPGLWALPQTPHGRRPVGDTCPGPNWGSTSALSLSDRVSPVAIGSGSRRQGIPVRCPSAFGHAGEASHSRPRPAWWEGESVTLIPIENAVVRIGNLDVPAEGFAGWDGRKDRRSWSARCPDRRRHRPVPRDRPPCGRRGARRAVSKRRTTTTSAAADTLVGVWVGLVSGRPEIDPRNHRRCGCRRLGPRRRRFRSAPPDDQRRHDLVEDVFPPDPAGERGARRQLEFSGPKEEGALGAVGHRPHDPFTTHFDGELLVASREPEGDGGDRLAELGDGAEASGLPPSGSAPGRYAPLEWDTAQGRDRRR